MTGPRKPQSGVSRNLTQQIAADISDTKTQIRETQLEIRYLKESVDKLHRVIAPESEKSLPGRVIHLEEVMKSIHATSHEQKRNTSIIIAAVISAIASLVLGIVNLALRFAGS